MKLISLFKLYSLTHIAVLLMTIFIIIFLITILKDKNDSVKSIFRYTLAIVIMVAEISYLLWIIANDKFDPLIHLPFNICSICLFIAFFMLLTKKKIFFEILYFWGISGSCYALIFPNVIYGFPHFRFFEFFIAHGSILLSVFYMIFIEKYILDRKSLLTVSIFTGFYIIFIFTFNLITGANYLFLKNKPVFRSFYDFLGPWPIYPFLLIPFVTLLFILMYLIPKIRIRKK